MSAHEGKEVGGTIRKRAIRKAEKKYLSPFQRGQNST